MDTTKNAKTNNGSQRDSIGSAIHEIVQESKKRSVVIRKSSGRKVIDISVLLAVILSISAPILPAFVFLGVLVEAISVSFKQNEQKTVV
jgi:hypothetical protein